MSTCLTTNTLTSARVTSVLTHFIKEIKHRERLIKDKVIIYDKKAEIYEVLKNFNIPYEYDEIENAFLIYGYKS
ncbi:DUF6678 family protein [Fusobacterium periodonticum]|nr:DUF6678 family protein [Fusobacterium periodonticum]KGE63204.1 hypothetical protein FSAG_000585 [Fusobacterium periodonticum 2_1_31]